MKRVCAWCGKDLGEKPPLDNPAVTHGMCVECFRSESAAKPRKNQQKIFYARTYRDDIKDLKDLAKAEKKEVVK